MTLTFAIFSKLKACHHSAQRWSAATTLGQGRAIFSTLKGLHPWTKRDSTLAGLLPIGERTQGSAARNPGLKDRQPFRLRPSRNGIHPLRPCVLALKNDL